MVTIYNKEYIDDYGWRVECVVEHLGTHSGTEYVDLPQSATDEQLKESILRAYGKKI